MPRLKAGHLALLSITLGLLFISGCARPLRTGPLPPGISITPLTTLRGDGPVAWHPSGTMLAAGNDQLTLLDLNTGNDTSLDSGQPANLAWSPDGSKLAVAWPQGESTRLELQTITGTQLAEIVLPGRPDRLLWSVESGLLLITAQLKVYSFGADLTLLLHRWDGQTPPATLTLHNVTIKPAAAVRWQQGQLSGSRAVLSPTGGELLYLQLHDPPAFTGKYRLMLRHLASGVEKRVATLALTTEAIRFVDDERALVANGDAAVSELYLWTKRRATSWPYTGRPLAVSSGGRYWLLGDQLLDDGNNLLRIDNLQRALFSPDGSALLLQSAGNWHILTGLTDRPKPAISDAARNKLRQLRNWRSRGLITPDEFRQQQQRMLQP